MGSFTNFFSGFGDALAYAGQENAILPAIGKMVQAKKGQKLLADPALQSAFAQYMQGGQSSPIVDRALHNQYVMSKLFDRLKMDEGVAGIGHTKAATGLANAQAGGINQEVQFGNEMKNILGMPLTAFNAQTARKEADTGAARIPIEQQRANTEGKQVDLLGAKSADDAAAQILGNPSLFLQPGNKEVEALTEALGSGTGNIAQIFQAMQAVKKRKADADKATLAEVLKLGGQGAAPPEPDVNVPQQYNPFADRNVQKGHATAQGQPASLFRRIMDALGTESSLDLPGYYKPAESNQDLAGSISKLNALIQQQLSKTARPGQSRAEIEANQRGVGQLQTSIKALMSLVNGLQSTGMPLPPDVQATLQQLKAKGYIK